MKRPRIWGLLANDERGQMYVIVAISFVVLVIFSGLVIDVGMVFASKLQLSRAVDGAALSAAPEAARDGFISTAVDAKVQQIMRADNLDPTGLVTYTLSIPGPEQIRVVATNTVTTTFIKLIGLVTGIPAFQNVRVSASATAEYIAYAEIPIKPSTTNKYGTESAVNAAVWGPNSQREWGDAYSPIYGPSYPSANPEYGKLPNGYIYRISVPANYVAANGTSLLNVQLFDPDDYNAPVAAYTPGYDCRDGGAREDTRVVPTEAGVSPAGRCYFRVDEYRARADNGTVETDVTVFTLWYLDPAATSILHADPAQITTIATYTVGADSSTDLRWVLPPGFQINLNDYSPMADGSWNFYLYVRCTSGASENNFDIRTGPPQVIADEINMTPGSIHYHRQVDLSTYNWNSGGTYAFAVRAMPINFNYNTMETRYLTFVPPEAAGQKLIVRHFDNDYPDHRSISYYLKDVPTAVWSATGNLSGNNEWYGSNTTVQGDVLTLPPIGSSAWISGTETVGRWLAADYQAPFAQDTSVWELIYPRARLIK